MLAAATIKPSMSNGIRVEAGHQQVVIVATFSNTGLCKKKKITAEKVTRQGLN
jgi:hypothetical protein